MTDYTGRVHEVLLEAYQNASALLELPAAALPQAGQYLQIHNPADPDEILPVSLLPAGDPERLARSENYLLPVSGPLPASWAPGTELALRGPLGRGFQLPRRLARLVLVALADSPGRLLPLIAPALEGQAEIAIFSDGEPANLPLQVEAQPLSALPEGLAWADFVAADVADAGVESLLARLGLADRPAPDGQALMLTEMPCGGLADCGVCILNAGGATRLVCRHGPVFPLQELAGWFC